MSCIHFVTLCFVLVADKDLPVSKLMQEVSALQTLHQLKLTPVQLQALRKLAGTTGAKPDEGTGKASDEVRKTLIDLRAALIEAKNEERIDQLTEHLEKLQQAEEPDFEDDFEATESAIEQASDALRLLTAAQVADYCSLHIIPDPREMLREAIDKVRGLTAIEWNEFRETTAEQVAALIGGLDEERVHRSNDQIVQWLIIVRSLNDSEFKEQRKELEQRIDEIMGKVGPTDVLRHFMEHALVELLSNPRILTAIDLRLKAAPAIQDKPGN